jgi:hypothetical protein
MKPSIVPRPALSGARRLRPRSPRTIWSYDAISDGPQLGGTTDRTVLESSRDAAD